MNYRENYIIYMLNFRIMNEVEYKEILDRDKHVNDVKEHFGNELKLLTDIVNYGTNLIPRVFTTSNRNLTAIIVVGVLLKQVVSMLDSIEILLSNANIHASKLSTRALYEASIYIEWILKEQADKKAKYYYVSNLRGEKKWALRGIKDTVEHESFKHVRDQLNVDPPSKHDSFEADAKSHLAQVEKTLLQNSFKTINDELERLQNNNRRKMEPSWYKVFRIHSLRHMAKSLDRHAEYDLFYSQGSDVTHSARYKDHIRISKGKIEFIPIRLLEDMSTLLFFSISIAINAYKTVLNYYRPGEVINFERKYINDWRQTFLNIKSVNYKYEGQEKII